MNRISFLIVRILTIAALAACGSQTVRVEPVKVEPIHVTVDVNVHDADSGGAARR